MNAARALAAEQVIALTAGISRDLIDQGPARGLPRPRFLVAVFAFYGLLGVLSAFGRQPSRVAVAVGGVAALTTVAIGPGGIALAGLFQRLGGLTSPGLESRGGVPAGVDVNPATNPAAAGPVPTARTRFGPR